MALFGFKKDKKHEQSHIQAEAGLAKKGMSGGKLRSKPARGPKQASVRPEKVSSMVVTKDPGAAKFSRVVAPKASTSGADSGNLSFASVILRPRVTEKSGILSQSGVYTFEVASNATKATISRAVKVLYKVTPVKVAVLNLPAKKVFVRGRHGSVAGVRKAMVTVKKGDKIEFV